MSLLDRVAGLLADRAVLHALIGAAALAVRGIARSTFDVDMLTTDARVLDASFWAPLAADCEVDVRRGDGDDPLAGVVRVTAHGQRPVDVIVGRYEWQARAVTRAEQSAAGPPIVTAVDLVLLKLYAGGAQDHWDVRELLRQPGADHLAAQVMASLEGLPRSLHAAWEDVRRG